MRIVARAAGDSPLGLVQGQSVCVGQRLAVRRMYESDLARAGWPGVRVACQADAVERAYRGCQSRPPEPLAIGAVCPVAGETWILRLGGCGGPGG